MKWISHQLITASAVLAATDNPTMAILAGAMSPLPDKVDLLCGAYGQSRIQLYSHRKYSHFWGFWTILGMATFVLITRHGALLSSFGDYIVMFGKLASGDDGVKIVTVLLSNLAFWASIGSLFHIFEDFFSGMGVPLVFPNKISPHIKLYKTGALSEYIVTFCATSLCLWLFLEHNPAVRHAVLELISHLLS